MITAEPITRARSNVEHNLDQATRSVAGPTKRLRGLRA